MRVGTASGKPWKSSRLREIKLGRSISVTRSLRMRLSTLSRKPRYSLSGVMNCVELLGLKPGGAFAVAHDKAVGGALDHDLHEFRDRS